MKKSVIILASLFLAACASTSKTDSAQPAQPAESKPATAAPATAAATAAELAASKLNAELQALRQQSIYFDFDKYAVKPEYRDVILKQAEFLKSHKNDIVTLEGNTDEQGSPEYNLALGEKRATAVEKSLKLLGIPKAQIKVVSLGEEKPRLECHEEKCWKENRRVDFVHDLK